MFLFNQKDKFLYNRFTEEKLIECYQKATIENDTIPIPEFNIEVYLTNIAELQKSDIKDYDDIIKEALSNVPIFDNIIQHSLENDYKKSNLHIRNFHFSLSYIDISKDKIKLCYWGDEVNSEFVKTFVKIENKWIEQSKHL